MLSPVVRVPALGIALACLIGAVKSIEHFWFSIVKLPAA